MQFVVAELVVAGEEVGVVVAVDLADDVAAQLERVKRVVNQMGNPCESLLNSVYWEKLPMDIIAFNLGYKTAIGC